MESLFTFLICTACTTILAVIVYACWLRKVSFFKANRVYLNGIVMLSCALSFIHWGKLFQQNGNGVAADQPLHFLLPETATASLVNMQPAHDLTDGLKLGEIILLFMALGTAYCLIRFLSQVYSIHKIKKHAAKILIDSTLVYNTGIPLSPFSFYKSIILNQDMHSEAELRHIIAHEKIHIRERHYLDILLAEFFKILFWYNPANWLLSFFVRENIEYETDALMVRAGIPKKEYQYHLLQVTVHKNIKNLSVHFNYQHLKNRIKMMNQQPNPKTALLRYAFAIALVIPSVLLNPASARQKSDTLQSAKIIGYQSQMMFDSSELRKEIQAGLMPYQILDSLTVRFLLLQSSLHNINFKPSLQGMNIKTMDTSALKKEVTKSVKAAFKQTVHNKHNRVLPVDSIGFIIDGRQSSAKDFYALNPQEIKSLSILTADKVKFEQYNVGNKEAVVFITTQ